MIDLREIGDDAVGFRTRHAHDVLGVEERTHADRFQLFEGQRQIVLRRMNNDP